MPGKPSTRAQALKEDEFTYYLKLSVILFYYKAIRIGGFIEKDVDHFYNNFLPLYFKAEENYGVEQESRVAKDLGLSQ